MAVKTAATQTKPAYAGLIGAGTTLLVAQNHELPAVGIEINPFAAFLSRNVSILLESWSNTLVKNTHDTSH
ncbi:MAG: hypothetical protein RIM23_07010 [Coleofasciculus sp. G3-WIS-01]|uniref:hypothetical protein n=1 Tax=Coleofasciculus sp. G3-WIS-01 TaxID=3069528 RepID=UPI0032FD98BB